MKKILVLGLVILFFLMMLSSSLAVTVPFTWYDFFESWTNPNVANNWTAENVGGGGGGTDQIYDAGQGISVQGNGTNYMEVYRDITARAPYFYYFTVEAMSNSKNTAGQVDGTYVRFFIQFMDANNNVLATSYENGRNLVSTTYRTVKVHGYAPSGTTKARAILRVVGGTGGQTIFKNFNFYEQPYMESTTGVTLLVGENLTRSNGWINSNVAQGWGSQSYGNPTGEFTKVAVGGSSQGISCSGDGTNYRQVSRTYAAEAGYSYEAAVDAISNSMNKDGVVDPSYVVVYMQFLDSVDTVLATHQMTGKQAGIRPAEMKRIRVQAVSPARTSKVRVIMRVFGGTGGGTVFDNFSLTQH